MRWERSRRTILRTMRRKSCTRWASRPRKNRKPRLTPRDSSRERSFRSTFEKNVVVRSAAGPCGGYFGLAAIPARYALERRDWKSGVELQPRETPFPYTDAMTWFARGMGAARLHDPPKAQASVEALQNIRMRMEKANESYWAGQVEIQRLEVNAWSCLAEKRQDLALTMMKSAAEMEDHTDRSAITPGSLAPARELLGEMLLEINEPVQALEQFEATLNKEPNRFRALYRS